MYDGSAVTFTSRKITLVSEQEAERVVEMAESVMASLEGPRRFLCSPRGKNGGVGSKEACFFSVSNMGVEWVGRDLEGFMALASQRKWYSQLQMLIKLLKPGGSSQEEVAGFCQ